MSSIFVQLAAYHDWELPSTIHSLLNNSSDEHQINIGVHLCFYKEQDIELPNLSNVKYTLSKAPENIGIGNGRFLAHQHYSGEDYYLQIDAHSKMVQGWDSYAISQIEKYRGMGFAKPAITNYPKNYWYNDDGTTLEDLSNGISCISFHESPERFQQYRVPSQTAMPNPDGNIHSKSVSGGSIFTVGDFIQPSSWLAFFGEEICISAKAYTRGFDLLIPDKQFMAHLYYNHSKPMEVNKRRFVWKDFPDEFALIDKSSQEEIKDMFLENKIGPEYLGSDRTLKQFEEFSGLNFQEGTVL